MFIFTPDTLNKGLSPWGKEVARILDAKNLRHKDLLEELARRDKAISKSAFAQLLRGYGVNGKMDIVREVNSILDIPEVGSSSL